MNKMDVWQNSLRKKGASLGVSREVSGESCEEEMETGPREIKVKNKKCLVVLETWSQQHLWAFYSIWGLRELATLQRDVD